MDSSLLDQTRREAGRAAIPRVVNWWFGASVGVAVQPLALILPKREDLHSLRALFVLLVFVPAS